jgi:hypothetical protein
MRYFQLPRHYIPCHSTDIQRMPVKAPTTGPVPLSWTAPPALRGFTDTLKETTGIQEVKDSMDAVSVISAIFIIRGGTLLLASVLGIGIAAIFFFLQ